MFLKGFLNRRRSDIAFLVHHSDVSLDILLSICLLTLKLKSESLPVGHVVELHPKVSIASVH